MNNILVREATQTDDLKGIAVCIYLTDPFIYPAAFGSDLNQATQAIVELISAGNNLLSCGNLLVALDREKICGILLFNKNGSSWNIDQCTAAVCEYIPNIQNFIYVSNVYFAEEAKVPTDVDLEVIACCVHPEYRNRGIGKQLINHLIELFPNDSMALDVLANNQSAIRVYQKYGFNTMGVYKGFSMEEASRPDCYRMIRNPNV